MNNNNKFEKNAKFEHGRGRVKRELQMKEEEEQAAAAATEEEQQKKDIVEVVKNNVKKSAVINTVSLLTTRDMNETLIIDLITTVPPTTDLDDETDDADNEQQNYNVDDITQVTAENNSRAIKEQRNVNQKADFHMTFNVNDKNKNKNKKQNKLNDEGEEENLEREIITTTTINIEEVAKLITTIETNTNEINEQKEAKKEGVAQKSNNNNNFSVEKSLYKDIEEKAETAQQQFNNNSKEHNDDVAANQYLNLNKIQENKNEKNLQYKNREILVHNMSTKNNDVQENENKERVILVQNVSTKNVNNDEEDHNKLNIVHNADNYWSNDNIQETTATITTDDINMNCGNNTIADDCLIATTNKKQTQEVEEEKLDKFILNDRQIETTTIEKVEQNLMEINEQILIANGTEERMKPNVNAVNNNDNDKQKTKTKEANEEEEEQEEEDGDDDGTELGKLTPQHLLLDELMLNDGGVEKESELETRNANVVSNNDVLNYIDNENEDIDIVNLEDKDNKKQRQKQGMSADELYYKTLPAPQVMESFDKPNKRILVNVTIATDDADGSVYTLHVAVPTGRGKNNEKKIEQLLTHERRHTNAPSPYCYPEPPPTIPECPCACAHFTATND